jgi:hypothetical protein
VTDVQLYLAVGILTNVQHRSTNARFNSVETRLSNLEILMDARFNHMEVKFEVLTGKVIDVDNRVTRIEAKLGIG